MGAEEGFAGDEDSGWVDTHHYAQPGDNPAPQTMELGNQVGTLSYFMQIEFSLF